jgi:probable rRNA maturation factor
MTPPIHSDPTTPVLSPREPDAAPGSAAAPGCAADPDQAAEPPADHANVPGRGGLTVEAVVRVGEGDDALADWLAGQLARIAGLAGVGGGQLSLAVVGDDEMAQLHQQYKDNAGTTDVLTFDLRDDATDPVEGDIVICLDEASRQASRRGHDARLELLLCAVHGLLHLVGYDDHAAADAARMHRREDELLTAAGFGPVFANRDDRTTN